ncbi:phosphate/phosphite/phosphonate ABC transporter substrate-binding protein [Alkalihalophilus marmarensis]|jgi:phosphonate transport system substrate-binding protein|uniref:Phosphonate ABC transporter substrate-binding protein n=1 Tax=Alkalihalophilus marmarensis DSM 21297 TaxID=1188261 RepID=U6SMD1_9BACI|nr:phosphate/phosphite/phosphonate ABC transporter substrate-binding protein [Alkalihalophilus marmarensis]ERN52768.1 phosphonate ABC transporter substrate-binding protein [Alkalihalophilus marmarensis DSM 21297]MCM3488008.1 phosphate/phosphite/phosphonate ABC transporter substrate-binding protein [Alkalihalophilus marmarensis]
MKKMMTALLMMLLALMLAACGESNEETTATQDPEPQEEDTEVEEDDAAAEGLPDELIMGFVPSQDSDKIADTVAPLADRLSEELGIPVSGQVMTNYTALVEAMGNDRVHIGFIPAFGYVLATERYDNVEAILKSVRHGSSTYRAQYTVRADSGIESIEDLEGKVWAFPDNVSTSGYLFPAAQLMDEYGVEAVEDYFSDLIQAGSHDNAMIMVLEGDADVATTFEDARTAIEGDYPEAMDELVQLDFTADIPNDTISANTNMPADFIEQIRAAFLSFNDDEEMLTIMDEVYNWTGIDEAADSDYDVVRSTYEKFKDDGAISLD